MVSHHRISGAAALGLVLATTAGCPGSLDNKDDFLGTGGGAAEGSTGSGSADDVCNGLITKSCATSSCHVAGKTSPDLSLEGRDARVRDVEGKVCDGLLVDTANPEASLLYTKTSESDPACGNQMPLSGTKLDADELSCLLTWIESL